MKIEITLEADNTAEQQEFLRLMDYLGRNGFTMTIPKDGSPVRMEKPARPKHED